MTFHYSHALSKPFAYLFIGFALLSGLASTAWGVADTAKLDSGFLGRVTDGSGEVHSVVLQSDGKILVGGNFSYLNGGLPRNGIARYNSDGTLDSGFLDGLSGTVTQVRAIALQPDGKIIIGGYFRVVNDVPRNLIARLNPDGSLDTDFLNGLTGLSDAAFSIAVQPDGKIIVAGQFITVNGVPRARLVRLNADGSIDTGFLSGQSGPNATVRTVFLLPDGKILIGGSFTNVNGISRGGLARLNADGSLDASFLSGFSVGGNGNTVLTLTSHSDGRIIIGGDFTLVNGVNHRRVARINLDGTVDSAFPSTFSGVSSPVSSLALQPDGKVLIGGSFASVNGVPRSRIARLNVDGSLDVDFLNEVNGANNFVLSVALQSDGKVLLGGTFTSVNGQPRAHIARLSTSGILDASLSDGLEGPSGNVFASAVQTDGKILIGGRFTKANGLPRGRLARLQVNGTVDTSFLSGLSGFAGPEPGDVVVNSIVVQPDGKILVGGKFSNVHGVTRGGISRLNSDGSLDEGFSNGLSGVGGFSISSYVNDMVLQPDGKILIGGRFSNVNGVSRNFVARLNGDGTLDVSFLNQLSGPNNNVWAIALQSDGKILIGGQFTSINDLSRDYVARLNPDGSLDTSFIANANNEVWRIIVQPDDKVIIGGLFTGVNGTGRGRVARLESDGSVDLSFLDGMSGANSNVWALALQPDGKVLIGGRFTSVNGSPRGRIARLNPDGGLDASFLETSSGANTDIWTIALQADRNIIIGGWLTSFNGVPRGGIARIRLGGGILFDYDADGKSDLSVRRPTDNVWYLLQGTAGYTAQQFGEAGDRITPADYDGDGKTDVAVFRPLTGTWFVFASQSQTFQQFGWGANGDLPVPTDRDNDGKADLVVFRPSNNTWYTRYANGTFATTEFGVAGDKPLVGDFDADGIGDIALFRPSNNNWYILKSSLGFFIQTWGEAGDIPVPADFDGDGATDQGVFRPSTGQWFLSRTTDGFGSQNWGQAGDIPVAADYDGDGKADVAVFRPTNGTWYIVNSSTGQLIQQFGQAGDVPTQSAYIN